MTTAKHASNPPITNIDAPRRKPRATNHPPADDRGERRGLPSPHNNLALPRSPLIGRDHDVAAVQQLLLQEHVGLLTLTGPGGIGKTRLALQVAANLLDHFVDGVYFVALAPISDPALISMAMAQTLGVHESGSRPLQENLHDYLRDRQLLLVLDNFEQIVTAAPVVGELLSTCARLKVLVTSRATLHLYGEQEFPVPPLALPDLKQLAQTDPTSNLAHYAAIDLFCQRALAARPDFALTPNNAAAVAEICIKLDGLPLAIELAATRIKLFSPSALLARLEQRLALLTSGPADLPARQRTLRDAIAWSYALLRAEEQTLFRRLAVFVGGFTLEAAQAVGDAHGELGIDVLDGTASLVDQNLLKQGEQGEGEARFGMLETIREYGLERLEASGEVKIIRRYHAEFFLALAEATEPEVLGVQGKQALARLEAELDNFRAVLVWSETGALNDDRHEAELGLRLIGALAEFAMINYHHNEARGWMVSILQHSVTPTAARAKALWGAGLMAFKQGDYPDARAEFEQSVALWRNVGDQRGLALALCELCAVTYLQRQFNTAQQYGEESVALFRAVGTHPYLLRALENLAYAVSAQGDYATAHALFDEQNVLFQALGLINTNGNLGWLAGQQGDFATARLHVTEMLILRRADGHQWEIAEALNLLGEIRQRQGELEEARNHYSECLLLLHKMADKAGIAHLLHHLATIAQAQNQLERAICLFAVAATLRNVTGGILYRTYTDRETQEGAIAALQTMLSEEVFAAHWAKGQAFTLEQAIEYALSAPKILEAIPSTSAGILTVVPTPTYPAGLTAREVEVLRLMAQGLSYPEIADKLVISRRTVNAHVTSIFSKLGVTSRAAATRIAINHHLI